ncbi:leucine-rich repeat and coiled-coil domain-containing protein 1 [Lingula anatina]|uniref:Leucine-rich repeat and coiled-coil domain-containing protein 1 n=1 Tax=Lingula anatina TaxID=7574 RepID=A0A1S3IU94_LINAN|nr:leucine-rich repeat and coiled-coil domain-containing protein 1 [Lingula anatina]|eukprot:XP_013401506.2 leucine-rich repeat and coiled-coil domain-containing protein 1 [Lingula anatina]
MTSFGIDVDSEELCMIDSGLQSLSDVPIRQYNNLKVLNLHCNFLRRIENLQLRSLLHLDLSSNQIERIEGLDSLSNLRTLNLACNQITTVQGLDGLRALVKLNLSYNHITDISGFHRLQGRDYKLSHVELQGNRIQSVQHVIASLRGCLNLRRFTLAQDGSDNPVCSWSSIMSAVPQLQILDGVNRDGTPVQAADILADIPGLDQYMEFLLPSSSNSVSDMDPVALATPHIDEALEKFKERAVMSTSEVSTSSTTTDQETAQREGQRDRLTSGNKSPIGSRLSIDHELRLEKLEHQLAQVLYGGKSTRSPKVTSPRAPKVSPLRSRSPQGGSKTARLVAKRDVDQTDESDSEGPKAAGKSRRSRKTKIPSYQRATVASRERERKAQSSGVSSSPSGEDLTQPAPGSPVSGPRVLSQGEGPTAYAADRQLKSEIEATYVQLMQELEGERERRWKAEQATKKLVDHIQSMRTKAKEDHDLQDVAIQATTRLKQALTNEREAKLRLKEEVDSLKHQVKVMTEKLEAAEEGENRQHQALKAMEQTTARAETEHIQQQAHEVKKTQEALARAAAASREVDLLKNSVKTLKSQVHSLQELVANREQEHRKVLEGKFDLNSKEMQDAIAREVSTIREQHSSQLQIQQEKMDTLMKQYTELEDEFRMALQIESDRFRELQAAFQKNSREAAENTQALLVAQKKDETQTQMIADLTALVKEQKGRLTELSKSRQEQLRELRERNLTLEGQVEDARKKMVQLELLKQERTKMQSQIQAQESVIEGLKAERKLWGQELAQQGSALAQDRGRLEAKIEALTSEVNSLKKQLDREVDALKIKSKMLDDQTETIRKLKDALVERDEEIKRARDEGLKIQKDLESQLTSETSVNQDLQEKVDKLTERKEELKQQVADLTDELEESKKAHSILNKRWKEKSEVIGQLEKQVRQMKDVWESNEKKLTEERDKAIQGAR